MRSCTRHLAYLASLFLLAACGEPSAPGPGGPDAGAASPDAGAGGPDATTNPPDPSAPRFLTFGTNVTSIGWGGAVTFTAVLTDPDGIDDLIGGSLTSPDGAIQYGAFATSGQEGSYTLTLDWNSMNRSEPITFATHEDRQFRAAFFDVAGHLAERLIAIELTCGGRYACGGTCLDMCGATSQQRQSCDQVCTAQGMVCAGGTFGREANYSAGGLDGRRLDLETCATIPPPTYPGLDRDFDYVECDCIPLDP
ncbi:MAG: hypothetical protein KA297_06820, partial [Kofleriaceae bacterium]|nr:hypothetical protein [Kofleriaceae bacterium]MBP6836897.1 hypothetical protein [Kofleriaceae bacterium]